MIRKRLVLGTTNPEKVLILRAALAPLAVETPSLADLGIALHVPEDGASLEENAEKKARAYAAASGLPVLAVDGGLHIDGLPEDRQPGMFVRRISGPQATDQEVLEHYAQELARLGGATRGVWTGALALAAGDERVITYSFSFEVIMEPEPKGSLPPGAPLNCLMTDPASGKHYSDLAHGDRPDIAELRAFVERHLDAL